MPKLVDGGGLLLTMGSITGFVISPISGTLSDLFGTFSPSTIGTGTTVIALFLWYNFAPEIQTVFVIAAFIVGGMGGGTFQTTNSCLILGAVKPEKRGSASALIASAIGLGLSMGMAFAGTIYSARRLYHQKELIRGGS